MPALRLLVAIAPCVLAAPLLSACANKEYDQCGGKGFSGETCCQSYDECNVINEYYSQCQPLDLCLVPQYGQCNGTDSHTGQPWDPKKKCCPASFHCVEQNQYYWQCLPSGDQPKDCAAAYEQCGGKDAAGQPWGTKPEEKTCCQPGYECHKTNEYYSGCNPIPICTNARYGQCGGIDAQGHPWVKDYGHDDCCPPAFKCQFQSQYYSQCMPATE